MVVKYRIVVIESITTRYRIVAKWKAVSLSNTKWRVWIRSTSKSAFSKGENICVNMCIHIHTCVMCKHTYVIYIKIF